MNLDYANEIKTNPLIKLMMSDNHMSQVLLTNPDPKLAETLIENKLKNIGLNDQEIAVMYMKDGAKYSLEQAMKASGLDQQTIDHLYDSAVSKVNNVLGGGGILGNLNKTFGNNPPTGGGLYK